MLDNVEMNKIMEKLEQLDDEALAVSLLKEFNDKTSKLGKLLMNLDSSLSSVEWKEACDQAQKNVDIVVEKINSI